MTKKAYRNIFHFFNKHLSLYKLLIFLYRTLPYFIAISYGLLLIISFVFYKKNDLTYYLKTILVPAIVFLTVTIFRKLFNFQRPYEKFDFKPLISKNTKGHSFPSRHTASAFIISMVFLQINAFLGCLFIIVSTLIALTRILSGVHFLKDVLFGGLFSIIIGCIFIL